MRSLTQVYGEYEDRIHFIGIGQDAGENAGAIRSWSDSNGFTWPMTVYDRAANNDYRITVQASAVVLDANGIILSRSSYSGSDKWQELFDSLLDG